MNHHVPTAPDCAAALHRIADRIAPTVALIIALAIHTYWAGHRLGRAVHGLSDWLATHWPTRPTDPAPAHTPAPTPALPADPLLPRVLALRAAGLSQRAIAEQCGVSRATVRRRLAMV